MVRARILLGALSGPLLWAFSAPAPASPPAPTHESAQADGQREKLGAFLAVLAKLRAGEEGAAARLLDLAEDLCVDYARCDTVAVARYYADLSPEQRAGGLAAERAFLELRERAVQAGREGPPPGRTWPEERQDLYDQLGSLAVEVASQADVVPAAQAYAFLARLELSELEEDLSLSPERSRDLFQLIPAHIDRSLSLFERSGQVTPRLEPLWLRGRLARARQELGRAREVFEDCLRLAEVVDRVEYQERALSGLVDLAKDAGNLQEVDERLAAWSRLTSPSESWALAREHACRLLADDRGESALAFLVANAPTHAGHHAQWRGMLAVAFLRTGDLISARREVEALGSDAGEFASLARAALALAEGEPEQVRALLDDEQLLASWSTQGRVEAAALLGESWLDSGQPQHALRWLEHALDAARMREQLVQDRSGSIVGEWVGMHTVTLLARAHAELGDALSAAQVIEDNQSRQLRPQASRVTVEELRSWAAQYDRGLVTFGVGANETIVIWIDSAGNAAASTRPIGRRSLQGAVRRLREALLDGDLNRAQLLGAEISAALLPRELEDHLSSGRAGARVLFLLHGPLESMPLTVLSIAGTLLDEQLTPLVLPGLPLGEAAAPLAPDATWTLMGSPMAPESRARLLPGAARELVQLGRLYPKARLFTESKFVREAVVQALKGSDPLHLATHLVSAPNCGDGRLAPVGLLLSGGEVLCADEILAYHPRLPLVILAACETAGGHMIDAEGAHGVARAFLEGGTRDLLVTMWPVTDSAARAFALAFHRALQAGAPPATAAREARSEMRGLGYLPAEWAAFRSMGRD